MKDPTYLTRWERLHMKTASPGIKLPLRLSSPVSVMKNTIRSGTSRSKTKDKPGLPVISIQQVNKP